MATEALYRNPLHGGQELLSSITSEMQAEFTREIEESSSSSISDMDSEVEGLRCQDNLNLSLPSVLQCNLPHTSTPGRDGDSQDYCSEEENITDREVIHDTSKMDNSGDENSTSEEQSEYSEKNAASGILPALQTKFVTCKICDM